MKAVRYWAKEEIRYEDIAEPVIGEDEVLIQIEFAGICGSDVSIYSGVHPRAKAPLVMGHEFSGTVAALPAGYNGPLTAGDRVTVNPLLTCRHCTPCRSGNNHVCKTLGLTGIDQDGGFAEFVKVALEQVVALPKGMSGELGVIVEPVAVAVHAVRRSALAVGDFALVVGGGPIGFLLAAVARLAGARKVVVIEPNEFRRGVVSQLGVDVLSLDESDKILEMTDGDGADVVFEAAGVPSSIETAVRYCKIRGQIVNAGVFKQPAPVNLQRVNFAELDIVGTRVYTREAFAAAVELAQQHPEIFSKVITHKFPLAQAQDGLDLMKKGGNNLKILLYP